MDVNASANRVERAHARLSPARDKLACSGTEVLVSMCDDSEGGSVRASDTAGATSRVKVRMPEPAPSGDFKDAGVPAADSSGTGVRVFMCADDSKGGAVCASDTAGVMEAVARDIAVDSSPCACVRVCMHGAG